ncbi:lipid-A-disaccharide synthase [Marinicauda algicola]|uniref:Lipid-A-disaccharide synthase n=1 Tax=Marinicauda algicola TaxID=2029849 RepID=A0A4S2GX07_9PROT|nr:lipid-A-disaccharide synthase [Marinicauda algicola]TGY87418.1 lipid-A-disaccharide synthase [Marinicauda algicola]
MSGKDRPLRLFLVAAETSGDLLGADLARALKAQRPDIVLAGVGGEAMAEEGIVSPFDISDLSIIGLVEGLKILKIVKQRAEETGAAAEAFRPDAVVLIDSWGFMLRAAWRIRERLPDVPLIKYVGPQVFATRAGRARVLAKATDHLLGIHPFDPDYFEPAGLPTTFVGNPALERLKPGDGPAFRRRHGIDPDVPVLLVLFGSRRTEIDRLYDRFAEAAATVRARHPGMRLVTVIPGSVAEKVEALLQGDERLSGIIAVRGGERADAFSASDVALACSGTVTLELALCGVPTVTGYRLDWLSWAIARVLLMRSRYISLVNIAADEELILEYVQTRCTPGMLADGVETLLRDPARRAEISRRLVEQTREMRGEGGSPSDNAAAKVIEIAERV